MPQHRLYEEFPPRFLRDRFDGAKELVFMIEGNRDFLAELTDEVKAQDPQEGGTGAHEGEHGFKVRNMTPLAIVDFVPGKRIGAAKSTLQNQ
jgi:hypothetical protein